MVVKCIALMIEKTSTGLTALDKRRLVGGDVIVHL